MRELITSKEIFYKSNTQKFDTAIKQMVKMLEEEHKLFGEYSVDIENSDLNHTYVFSKTHNIEFMIRTWNFHTVKDGVLIRYSILVELDVDLTNYLDGKFNIRKKMHEI
jgi:hypothetical protein